MANHPARDNSRLKRRRRSESVFKFILLASVILVSLILSVILVSILWKGLPALKLSMILKTPGTGYYLGQSGGILNAIVGSIEIAFGATCLALVIALPLVIYLNTYLKRRSFLAEVIRLSLDVLWGIPSIV